MHQEFLANNTFTEVSIEGVKRSYAILTEDLPELVKCQSLEIPEGIHFISPLDSLLWYRERLVDLYDFHYRWEIYTPKQKRMYG
ncbi:crosslink repair DNA glycosylase YcaQ family protein, partial [Bacillus sp. SIMBA_069]